MENIEMTFTTGAEEMHAEAGEYAERAEVMREIALAEDERKLAWEMLGVQRREA